MKKKQSYHSQKIEVMKTTAKDVGFFFFPSLQEPQSSSKQKLKQKATGPGEQTQASFWATKEVGQEASKPYVSINSR